MDEKSDALLGRYVNGDSNAAFALFDRYVDRLRRLARSRLSEKLARRVDPEDVVQSAYRSFFLKAQEGRFELQKPGDLWRLLGAITVNKVLRQVEFHGQKKRDLAREEVGGESGSPLDYLAEAGRDPGIPEVVAFLVEFDAMMDSLSDRDKRIFELHLEGRDALSIGDEVGCSEWTVRRALNSIEAELRAT